MRAAVILLSVLASAAMTGSAWGHGSGNQKAEKNPAQAVEEKPFGRPGDPRKVVHTIRIEMRDEMEYLPNGLRVKAGETVKFIVRNSGRVMHELVLGTMEELKAHAELMRKHPGMEHDEPHMVHVPPGRTGTLVWQFTRPGAFYYGCLLPGHFEAGMVGIVRVRAN
ncbi:MAG TPA: cupredoxin family protein [Burkholderiales bacterium]|nr:cupredoxin family protein [Burkholderiales bacterium]